MNFAPDLPLLILMYHRFMADDGKGYVLRKSIFERQVRFIRRAFTVIALDEYLSLDGRARERIRNPLAITVDDGYRNFFVHAYPVLKQYNLPATVYLPVNFIENGGWMWQDKNKFILRNSHKTFVDFQWNNRVHRLNLSTFDSLMNSMETVYILCMKISLDERGSFSRSLADAADIVLPEEPDEEFAPLTWDEITELRQHKIYFGSHTMNHEILTEADTANAAWEIRESKIALEKRLGRQIRGFCYPNGNYNDTISREVEQSGYTYAVTTNYGFNTGKVSPMELKRIPEPSGATPRELVRGLFLGPVKSLLGSYMKEAPWIR